jgi:hypothetical protein
MKGKIRIALTVFSCFTVLGFTAYYLTSTGTAHVERAKPTVSGKVEDSTMEDEPGDPAVASVPMPFPGVENKEEFIEAAVARLKQDFGGKTIGKARQMQLMGLRQYLRKLFPENHLSVFRRIMASVFPSQADEIVKTLDRLEAYNTWLDANKPSLSQLPHHEISKALWAKRTELFGNDAKAMFAEETRTEAVKDILDIIRDSYETSLNDKLELYVASVGKLSNDDGNPLINDKKLSLTRAFISLDSVQAQLSDMDETQRTESLRSIRKTMGYSEPELDAMARKDEINEGKWQMGFAYMQERNDIFHGPDDGSRSEKLAELQNRYFGKAAKTIQAEEASGFFRFDRPRIYGRN